MKSCWAAPKPVGSAAASAFQAVVNGALPGSSSAKRLRWSGGSPATKLATVPPPGRLVI